jgi:hypothetical protein
VLLMQRVSGIHRIWVRRLIGINECTIMELDALTQVAGPFGQVSVGIAGFARPGLTAVPPCRRKAE